MWLLALFSLLPALGTVHVLDRWTVGETDREGRSLARLMLLACGLFIGAAVTLRMDMLMGFFIVLALRQFWLMWAVGRQAGRARWLFPLYLFLAVFTKGPLGLLIPLVGTVVFLAFSHGIRRFFRYWGWRTWGVLLACCLVWFGAVYAEGGVGYLHNLLVHQTVDRAVNSFHHEGPFYYYAISIWYSLAPWSLAALGVLAAAWRSRLACAHWQRFFLCVGLGTFVLLSCISAKLQIYFLPAIPFLIWPAAVWLPRFRTSAWLRVSLAVPAAVFALALPLLMGAAAGEELAYLRHPMLYAAAAVLTLAGIGSLCGLLGTGRREADAVVPVRRLAAGLLLAVFTGGWALPEVNAWTGYGALCREALELSGKYGVADFRTWRISRPESMDVYLHRPVQAMHGDEPPHAGEGGRFLLLTRKNCLKHFPGREAQAVGSYAVVVFP